MWPAGPAASKDPPHAPYSNRRHGAAAPPSPSMRTARRWRAAWLRFRAPPVDRQHPAGLDTARRTPGSARFVLHRGADRPPSRHRPNRIRRIGGSACSCGPLSRAQTRSGGAQPPVGRPSALGRLDSALNPALGGPCRRLSRPPAAAQAARQLPAPTLPGTPGTPTPAPRSVPGTTGARGTHRYSRPCTRTTGNERGMGPSGG